MSGLRAKQKANRHIRILEAATALFRDYGYDAVKMEAIAAEAEVSIGTIYNYYQNKDDLLVAIVAMEVNEVLAAGERVIAMPHKNALQAIDRLIGNYIEHSLKYLSKEIWRQAMAISTQQPDSPFGIKYAALDVALAQQTCKLIKRLQDLRLLRSEVNARAIGELVFNNINMMFIVFVKSDNGGVVDLRKKIMTQLKPTSVFALNHVAQFETFTHTRSRRPLGSVF
jgi:AcrR family transcriptional regulator